MHLFSTPIICLVVVQITQLSIVGVIIADHNDLPVFLPESEHIFLLLMKNVLRHGSEKKSERI